MKRFLFLVMLLAASASTAEAQQNLCNQQGVYPDDYGYNQFVAQNHLTGCRKTSESFIGCSDSFPCYKYYRCFSNGIAIFWDIEVRKATTNAQKVDNDAELRFESNNNVAGISKFLTHCGFNWNTDPIRTTYQYNTGGAGIPPL
jgi:hypothetical protein